MKTFLLKIKMLVVAGLFSAGAIAQQPLNQCACFSVDLVPSPGNSCCFEVRACVLNPPACQLFNTLTINTNYITPYVSITGATASSGISVAQNLPYQVVFTTNNGQMIVPPAQNGCPNFFKIGEICFAKAPPASGVAQWIFSNPNGGTCVYQSQFMTCSGPCASTQYENVKCGKVPGTYDFSFQLCPTSTSGGGFSTGCTYSMKALPSGAPITPLSITASGPFCVNVAGSFPAPLPPSTPGPFQYEVVTTCPNKPPCTLNVNLTLPCCEEITLNDASFCSTAASGTMPVIGIGAVLNIYEVNWYVNTWPCTGTPVGTSPFQQTQGYQDLQLPIGFLVNPGMYCVWAEVKYICPYNGQVRVIKTNKAKLSICSPPVAAITPTLQEFCSNAPVNASPLFVQFNSTNCPTTYQWFQNGAPVGNGGVSYQPSGLSYAGGIVQPDNCSSIYQFQVTATNNICGSATATHTIVIYNSNGDPGKLDFCNATTLPLCCDDDAEICYTPGCINPNNPKTWKWYYKTNNVPWTLMPYAGSQNPQWQANKICEEYWYRVESTNGVCTLRTPDLHVTVKPKWNVAAVMTAVYDNKCAPSLVNLSVSASPTGSYTYCWYKDGILIGTTTSATFVYSAAPPLWGNYYTVVKDLICGDSTKSNVVRLYPQCEVEANCPCYLCPNGTALLVGEVKNCPPGTVCTYSWAQVGMPPFANTQNTTTNVGDVCYEFTATCDGCTYTSQCCLPQCETLGHKPSETEAPAPMIGGVRIQPNPTVDEVTLIFEKPLITNATTRLLDASGRVTQIDVFEKGMESGRLNLQAQPPGIYILEVQMENGRRVVARIVKQ